MAHMGDALGKALLASDRRFQVWAFEVGHSQLILRSVKRDEHRLRVDVLFKGVDAMNLPTSFRGLTIVDRGDRFALSGAGWDGSVVAAACFIAEDEGEYFDPSPFADSLA